MNGRTHRGTGQRYGQNRQESFARFAAAQLSCNSSVESRIMVAKEKNTRFERSGGDNDMDLFGNLEADLFRFIIRKSDCHESVSAGWSRTVIQRHLQNR